MVHIRIIQAVTATLLVSAGLLAAAPQSSAPDSDKAPEATAPRNHAADTSSYAPISTWGSSTIPLNSSADWSELSAPAAPSHDVITIPLPASYAMAGAGLASLLVVGCIYRYRRRKDLQQD